MRFLSPDQVARHVPLSSPLERALAGADGGAMRDVSPLGKVEVRGDLDAVELEQGEELVPLGPRRALVLRDGSTASLRERLQARGLRVYDCTGTYAGLEVRGEALMRRLTDLDLEALPATGPVARGVPAVVTRDGDWFRLLVPQELGHYVAETALDLAGHVGGQTRDMSLGGMA